MSDWSCGQDRTEYSIVQALVATIAGAEHYVFIENQFFISHVKTGVAGPDMRNDRSGGRSSSCCCCPPSRGRLLG